MKCAASQAFGWFLISAMMLGGGARANAAEDGARRLLYVTVPDGAGGSKGQGIYIFDIDDSHKFVRKIEVPDMGGTRGVCASPATDKIYYAHGNTKLACMDLRTERKLWENVYPKSEGGADRIQITPDGKKLYVPSGWWSSDPFMRSYTSRFLRLWVRAPRIAMVSMWRFQSKKFSQSGTIRSFEWQRQRPSPVARKPPSGRPGTAPEP